MNFAVLSINYKLAPVEIRERLDIPEHQLPDVLAQVRSRCALRELMIVSTCNRVEFYLIADDEPRALSALTDWVAEHLGTEAEALSESVIVLTHRAAMIHLFRVASSLESMVVGEPQILGQVKDAYEIAVRERSVGTILMGLMPRVFRAAKRVRTETSIARSAVSISYAAVELASRIFDSLQDKTVMVIGAGEMAELAINHLLKQGIAELLLTNRTFANAVALSEKYQGTALPYDRLEETLPQADIVISSTGARGFIIEFERMRQVMRSRRGRPMFLIDIAVPRDIDPRVNNLTNAYCYDIDDLRAVTDANKREREQEALKAQHIVEEEVARFERWFESLSAVPTIKALRQSFHTFGESELDRTLGQLAHLTSKDAHQVRRLVHNLINKLLHNPSQSLKQLAEEGNGQLYAEALTHLFGLGTETASANSGTLDQGVDSPESDDPGKDTPADNVVPLSRGRGS